jgi:endonuclease G, mitochondrial
MNTMSGGQDNFGKNIVWYIAGILAIGVLFFVGYQKFSAKDSQGQHAIKNGSPEDEQSRTHDQASSPAEIDNSAHLNADTSIKDYFPESKGEIVIHTYYSLSYIEKYEQPEWVCYPLSKQILMRPNFPRSDWFNEDPKVSTGSAKHFQYKGSGYTRGHLAPAADMSFDKQAMEECFYMSNMSPQLRGVNNGIWRELEEQTRDWTYQNKEVYIVSGPHFNSNVKYFKKHKIAIPDGFFKVILDLEGPEKKGLAFYIPHEVSDRPLQDYAMSIDELEKLLNINLFAGLNQGMIELIESKIEIAKWPISEARYKLRVTRWNAE